MSCPIEERNKEIERLYKKAFPNEYAKEKELERDVLQWDRFFRVNPSKKINPLKFLEDAFDY